MEKLSDGQRENSNTLALTATKSMSWTNPKRERHVIIPTLGQSDTDGLHPTHTAH